MNALTTLRYLVFAVFIVCNAVLASVAVWNSSLITSSGRDSRVDIYLVVVGALGLALTFTIVFVELIRRNAFTSRVWFEILWTTLFLLMDLAGASILTSVGPADLCKPPSHSKKSSSSPLPGSCASTRVLMAFTWLCTFVLLIYLVLLVVLTVVNRHNEAIPRIWECTIHNFPPLTAPRVYQSPAPPILPRFTRNQMTEVPATPAPQRPTTVPSALYSLRSIGLNSQYQIEHFKPPESRRASRGPTSPVASPADYLHRVPSAAGNAHAAMALYPRYISSIYVPPPPAASSQQPQAPPPPQPTQSANYSPPPLGDWPRVDAPLRAKRKLPPTAGLVEGQSVSPTRPVGPRTRTGNRPPPLDMTSVRPRRDRDQQD